LYRYKTQFSLRKWSTVMKKACCSLSLAALCLGIAPVAHATQFPLTAEVTSVEQPHIPLERSLLPFSKKAEGEWGLPTENSSTTANILGLQPNSHHLANAVVRGLLVANRTDEIAYGSPLRARVQDAVRRLRYGDSLAQASVKSKVPQTTLTRLLALGQLPNNVDTVLWGSNTFSPSPSDRLITSHLLANAIVRGLLVANRSGEIGYAAPLSYRVQSIVRILRRGAALTHASHQARVPMPVVDHLLQLGQYNSVQIN
jgi:hypothetical protein